MTDNANADHDATPAALRLNDQLGQLPERGTFAAWWRENWPEATPQSESFAEAERCAMLAWTGAVAAERERLRHRANVCRRGCCET